MPFAHGVREGASLDTHTVDAHTFAHGARARFTLDTHLGASRLVSAGRGSTQALDGARARFGALPGAAWEPRGSFLLVGAALQALDGARARFGAPPLDAARRSLAARFCWQGQHFRLWTVPERVSGPPSCCQARHLVVSAGRGSTSGSGRYPSAFRGPPLDAASTSGSGRYPSAFRAPPPLMLPGAALGLAPPSRRRSWEPRSSFLLAGAALQALDGARARFGALPGAALGSLAAQVLDSLLLAHTLTRTLSQLKLGARKAVSATAASTCF